VLTQSDKRQGSGKFISCSRFIAYWVCSSPVRRPVTDAGRTTKFKELTKGLHDVGMYVAALAGFCAEGLVKTLQPGPNATGLTSVAERLPSGCLDQSWYVPFHRGGSRPTGDRAPSRLVPAVRRSGGGGPLLAWVPSFVRWSELAAGYVDRILKGANLATMPVEESVPFLYTANPWTAPRSLQYRYGKT